MQIETERLRLDPLTVGDADAMVEMLGDPALYDVIGGDPPTLDALRARYARLAVGHSDDGHETWLNWIVRLRDGGRAVGTVQATVVDDGRHADVAWVIGRPWQGRGIASEAAIALVAWLAQSGVERISAHVQHGHVASESVAARAGLLATGRTEAGEQVWELTTSAPAPG
jgi:RimJ/RimL family protein N-acetyltransferase